MDGSLSGYSTFLEYLRQLSIWYASTASLAILGYHTRHIAVVVGTVFIPDLKLRHFWLFYIFSLSWRQVLPPRMLLMDLSEQLAAQH